jgi:hypothetical protein
VIVTRDAQEGGIDRDRRSRLLDQSVGQFVDLVHAVLPAFRPACHEPTSSRNRGRPSGAAIADSVNDPPAFGYILHP